MDLSANYELRSRGFSLDSSPGSFGFLRSGISRSASHVELTSGLNQDGYLFVRDMFPSEQVLNVRREICQAMSEAGLLCPTADIDECIPASSTDGNNQSRGSSTLDEIPNHCPAIRDLLYGESAKSFFEKLLGGPVKHFDLTWFRGIAPGLGTVPHCDIVYMGRGTHDLYTMWVPYGEISLEMGGLMILENSNSDPVQHKIKKYLERDVDEFCENRPLPEHVDLKSETDNKVWNGWLARNPVSLRNNLGGRWLTAEYRPGDALIFSCKLIHGSLDNQSLAIRLSSDCRYQRADHPADQRFTGSGPFGHIGTAKRGRVC